jgi:hypothetical protein
MRVLHGEGCHLRLFWALLLPDLDAGSLSAVVSFESLFVLDVGYVFMWVMFYGMPFLVAGFLVACFAGFLVAFFRLDVYLRVF